MNKMQSYKPKLIFKSLQQNTDLTIQSGFSPSENDSKLQKDDNARVNKSIHCTHVGILKLLIFLALITVAFLFCSTLVTILQIQIDIKTPDDPLRLLTKYNFGQVSINVRTINEVPRWITLDYQQANKQQQMGGESDTRIDDISHIILGEETDLDSELFAGITKYKQKLGNKLLDLRLNPLAKYERQIYDFERQYYQQRYQISKYSQRPLCIIVPTYNNVQGERYRYNLQSIIQQEYSNYKVVIIDDASKDQTAYFIKRLIDENKLDKAKFTFIENKVQKKALYNIRYAAVTYCNPNDIMIIVDGDDLLIGKQVFKLFNAVFQKESIWFAYSNFIDVLNRNIGYSKPFPPQTILSNSYRDQQFLTSHLRAFYVSLFLKIKEEDLKNSAGEYYQAANDFAICIPILEMSGKRIKYIPELTYGYNSNTGNNNHQIRRVEQQRNTRDIRHKEKYQILGHL